MDKIVAITINTHVYNFIYGKPENSFPLIILGLPLQRSVFISLVLGNKGKEYLFFITEFIILRGLGEFFFS